MNVTEIKVNGFRNLLAGQTISLDRGVNVFVGDNAQGKTNLLETVYLCCLGKSPRTDKDSDMICFGQDKATVEVTFSGKDGDRSLAVELTKNRKTAFVNGTPLQRIGELLGYLNCIYFSPEEIRIITLSPAERRHFLDVDLCQLDKSYFYSLVRFNKILTQRNNLLKNSQSVESLKDTLPVWDLQLAREGVKIIKKRRNFCQMLAPLAQKCHKALTKTEELHLEYVSSCDETHTDEAEYVRRLNSTLYQDFKQRFTSFGCQRDDIRFDVDGIDVRSFGSQGQQRTTALSLKLAELELFKSISGEYPVLLLDDVMSELDRKRKRALLTFNPDIQVILTTTAIETAVMKNLPYVKYVVSHGAALKK